MITTIDEVHVPTKISMTRSITFQCAHHLPKMPEGHKCRRKHGHTYKLTIVCEGEVGDDGVVFDNSLIDEVLMVAHASLDHQDLNEIGFPFSHNPTAENMLLWFWKMASVVPVVGKHLLRIELQEGDRSTFAIQR